MKEIRDTLTHRFFSVRMSQEPRDGEIMSEEDLVKRTLELARIVRSAIIYLLHFVHVEETRKEATKGGPLPSILVHDLPDDLKSSRQPELPKSSV